MGTNRVQRAAQKIARWQPGGFKTVFFERPNQSHEKWNYSSRESGSSQVWSRTGNSGHIRKRRLRDDEVAAASTIRGRDSCRRRGQARRVSQKFPRTCHYIKKRLRSFNLTEPLVLVRQNYCGRGGGVSFGSFFPPSGCPWGWPRSAAAGAAPRCCCCGGWRCCGGGG